MHRLRKMLRCHRGAAALEFALALPVFLLIILGMIEFGLLMFGNAAIEHAVTAAARKSMVGCEDHEYSPTAPNTCSEAYTVDPARLRREIVRYSVGLVNACDTGKFKLNVNTAGEFSRSKQTVNLGQGSETMIFAVSYQWPIVTPMLQVIRAVGYDFTFHTTLFYRNEAFGPMQGRVQSDGGC